jgi:hypothetical protein
MKRTIAGVLGTTLLVACQDAPSSAIPPLGASFHISEARFGNGNPDLFFAPPLAETPQPGNPNFDVGKAHPTLVPFVRICETNGAPTAAGCLTDVTLQVTGSATGLSMAGAAELYQTNWRTTELVVGRDYRIEIWGIAFSTPAEKAALDARWLFGWRDIRNSATPPASCDGAAAFCLIRFGSTIPVTVRIEQFVFCPLTKNCAVQFVSAGTNANLEATLPSGAAAPNAQLFIPGQAGTNFAVAFEPCTAAEDAAVSAAVDIPTFGPCVKTETNFTAALGTPAIVSLCNHLDPSGFGLAHSQQEQLALHHFSDDLSSVTSLPEAWQCGTATSSAPEPTPNGVLRLAHRLRDNVLGMFSARPLYAAAMIDRGGGGQTSELGSFFKLALPAKFDYVSPNDASQTGAADARFPLRALVTDLFGEPVRNARVRWRAVAPPNEGATVLGAVPTGFALTNAMGIAQRTVELALTPGVNVFHAYGRGIADSRSSGCIIPPGTPATCNGPRATYDPFIPFHVPEFDPSGIEVPIPIAEGTRLSFSVVGQPKTTARP